MDRVFHCLERFFENNADESDRRRENENSSRMKKVWHYTCTYDFAQSDKVKLTSWGICSEFYAVDLTRVYVIPRQFPLFSFLYWKNYITEF